MGAKEITERIWIVSCLFLCDTLSLLKRYLPFFEKVAVRELTQIKINLKRSPDDCQLEIAIMVFLAT